MHCLNLNFKYFVVKETRIYTTSTYSIFGYVIWIAIQRKSNGRYSDCWGWLGGFWPRPVEWRYLVNSEITQRFKVSHNLCRLKN